MTQGEKMIYAAVFAAYYKEERGNYCIDEEQLIAIIGIAAEAVRLFQGSVKDGIVKEHYGELAYETSKAEEMLEKRGE